MVEQDCTLLSHEQNAKRQGGAAHAAPRDPHQRIVDPSINQSSFAKTKDESITHHTSSESIKVLLSR